MAVWRKYPLAPMYEVSEDGEVRKGKKILKQYRQKNGYVYVWLNRGFGNCSVPVHRMVAETFLPRDPSFDRVDHINTRRDDNRVCNLRWTDALGNANNPITKINMSKAKRHETEKNSKA